MSFANIHQVRCSQNTEVAIFSEKKTEKNDYAACKPEQLYCMHAIAK